MIVIRLFVKPLLLTLYLSVVAILSSCSDAEFPADVDVHEDVITVVGSEFEFKFGIDDEPDVIEGVAAMVQRSADTEMGAKAVVHFLDNDSADLFDRKYQDEEYCPAPFFNRYATQYTLIPANDVVSQDLELWEVGSWKDVSRWENIVLEGNCVDEIVSIKKLSDGQLIRSRGLGNCKIFVIDSFIASSRYL